MRLPSVVALANVARMLDNCWVTCPVYDSRLAIRRPHMYDLMDKMILEVILKIKRPNYV